MATGYQTGGLQVYNISNNQVTGSAPIGAVGLDWQFSGVGNFSSVPGESDLLLRNSSTGVLQVYDINNNQITGSTSIGTVGVDWEFVGCRPHPSSRRFRLGLAQRQQWRIPSLQHRQQSDHRNRQPGRGGFELAAWRFCRRFADRIEPVHGQLR
jgi:hypothetical protein